MRTNCVEMEEPWKRNRIGAIAHIYRAASITAWSAARRSLERRSEIREGARKLRRQYLRYKEAEIIYSMSHKKLLELAGKAGAILRIDGTVLIDRETFNRYLEQFREQSTILSGKRYAR